MRNKFVHLIASHKELFNFISIYKMSIIKLQKYN